MNMETKTVKEVCKSAKEASRGLGIMCAGQKNRILEIAADKLISHTEEILAANERDMKAGREAGLGEGLLDRLSLDKKRVEAMASGIRAVASLPDPVGEITETFTRPNGLVISKVRVPMGVCGIIYEARPNVTADAFAICFKSGNACVLKGGSAAIHSNTAIAEAIKEGIRSAGADPDVLGFIESTDRESTSELMK